MILVTETDVHVIEDVDDFLGITIDDRSLEFLREYIDVEKEVSYDKGFEDSDMQDELSALEYELDDEKHAYESLYDDVAELLKVLNITDEDQLKALEKFKIDYGFN